MSNFGPSIFDSSRSRRLSTPASATAASLTKIRFPARSLIETGSSSIDITVSIRISMLSRSEKSPALSRASATRPASERLNIASSSSWRRPDQA